jgi:xanthine/CO dehydrogenase XdhC/CoxF family maturation factor
MKELQQILSALKSAAAGDAVLATLVKVEGSSYRRPGARLLLLADGRRIGSISGGCLEDDVITHARDVLANGMAKMITYDTTTENDLVWGVGLGCHGVVYVLIEKLPSLPRWADALRENFQRRVTTELAIVWRGSAGTPLGTCLASDLPPAPIGVEPAVPGLRRLGEGGPAGSSPPGRRAPPPASDKPSPTVFYQTVPSPTALVIFGAGDDAQPLVRFAKELGWQVTIVDPRPAFATPERFPAADTVIVARPEEAPARLALGADTLAVIMTHHYHHDLPLLRALLPRPLAYLGLLGPKKRTEKILSDLAADGFALTPAMRARLHAPVGLDLGADNPEEVALAILAEMKASLAGRDGRPLRERALPIHG